MVIRNITDAITALTEITNDLKRKVDKIIKQRNIQVVDVYGIEYSRIGIESKKATFYVSISPDMVHLERFQFKVVVINGNGAVKYKIKVNGVDITSYLIEQTEHMVSGTWFDGTNNIFPSKDLELDTDGIEGSFDLINVSNSLYSQDLDDDGERILKAGMKKIEIEVEDEEVENIDASILLYLKYSHLNR